MRRLVQKLSRVDAMRRNQCHKTKTLLSVATTITLNCQYGSNNTITYVCQEQQDEIPYARLTRVNARNDLRNDSEPCVDGNVLETDVECVVDITSGAVLEPEI